jgi:hypothetical protein
MTSLPPQRPVSQRRASPTTESSLSARETHTDRRSSFSAASVDSQTILLNSPLSQPTKPPEAAQTKVEAAQPPEPDFEPRKCWICFNDETEDDEFSSEWRSPCPCVLVAHEKCLLDWIADMEAPSSRRRAGGNAGQILCPQCKSEIRLERPRSVVVDTVRLMERLTGMMLLPGFVLVTATAVYTTLYISGVHTVFQIFGQDDGLQILLPSPRPLGPRNASAATRFAARSGSHMWRLALGVPMIPTVLVASRTAVADSFLPFLPLMFFASGGAAQHEMLQLSWPPSAAFTVAALPYVRGIYNAYYERVWLPRERRWLKEIQPRAGTEDAANDVPNQDGHVHGGNIMDALADDDVDDGNEVVEIEVDFDIFADWNNGGAADNNNAAENPPVPIARGPAHPIDPLPREDDEEVPPLVELNAEAAPAPNIPQQPARPRHQRARRERNIGFSTTSLADTILGALIFPSIAAAVGQALKQVLPASWVTPPTSGKPIGFLQTRWGRSIAGGCLFVGIKDAVLLYVRWRMAQNHRMRRVMDYDKSKGKKKTGKT